jgi:hypothetical protein
MKVDQSYPHCGPRSVELVEHKIYSFPLAQQVWRYAANIIWQVFAQKKRNISLRNSYSMLQFFFINLSAKCLNSLVPSGFS